MTNSLSVAPDDFGKLIREHPEETLKLIGHQLHKMKINDEDNVADCYCFLLENSHRYNKEKSLASTFIGVLTKYFALDKKRDNAIRLSMEKNEDISHKTDSKNNPVVTSQLNEIKEMLRQDTTLEGDMLIKSLSGMTLQEIKDKTGDDRTRERIRTLILNKKHVWKAKLH